MRLYIQQTSRLIFLFRHIHNFHKERLIRKYSSFRSTPSSPQVIRVLITHDQSTSFKETCKCHHDLQPFENPEMTCNSIYILNILFKHHKTAQHVRSTTHSSQDSPEKKAARLILTLVTGFVFFYWINTFLTVYLFVIKNTSWQLEKFGNFIASCYPSICPFLLIKNENRIYRINYIKTRIRIFSS